MPDIGSVINMNISMGNLQAIAEPSSPPSSNMILFLDSADGKIKIKRSNGDVVVIE